MRVQFKEQRKSEWGSKIYLGQTCMGRKKRKLAVAAGKTLKDLKALLILHWTTLCHVKEKYRMNIDKLFKAFPYIETKELILRKTEKEEFEEWYSLTTTNEYTPGKGRKISRSATYNVLSKHMDRDFAKRKTIFLGIYLKSEMNKLVGDLVIFKVFKNNI